MEQIIVRILDTQSRETDRLYECLDELLDQQETHLQSGVVPNNIKNQITNLKNSINKCIRLEARLVNLIEIMRNYGDGYITNSS
jgi:hypothetical protein